MDVLKSLLAADEKLIMAAPEKDFKVKRLSEICGEDVIFSLKALSYSRVADIKASAATKDQDMSIHIVLAGVTAPDLKSKELMEKFSVPTPAELLKKMLLAGEIEDLAQEIEKLSGYRKSTVEEVKKK
ncbi:phage tail assembly chaperone [Anaeromassilibacillus senegalensis]|uniref:phage tail assembly chaperone n=1 Tax=Anaeromassilibacillus senegalensis TaxID=1673717 RepID=UPI00067FC4CD|nr:XkdN [Anaeromassilibacillus senegalensis]